jgi:hypothetical protein
MQGRRHWRGSADGRRVCYESGKDNLRSLLERAKSGSDVAPPVRRVHIRRLRRVRRRGPIGIPTFEDKVLRRAVIMVPDAVYEQSFLDCSSILATSTCTRCWTSGCCGRLRRAWLVAHT